MNDGSGMALKILPRPQEGSDFETGCLGRPDFLTKRLLKVDCNANCFFAGPIE